MKMKIKKVQSLNQAKYSKIEFNSKISNQLLINTLIGIQTIQDNKKLKNQMKIRIKINFLAKLNTILHYFVSPSLSKMKKHTQNFIKSFLKFLKMKCIMFRLKK